MKSNAFRRLMCAALAAVMLCPAAMAEMNSDDVSGYNPFTGDYVAPTAAPELAQAVSGTNPFGGADLTAPEGFGTGGAVTADDLFGGNTTYTVDPNSSLAAVASDPFATGTASAVPGDSLTAGAANDPFGTGSASTDSAATGAVNDPFGVGSAETDGEDAEDAGNPFGGEATPQPTATPAPMPTVKGYNPFDTGESQPIQAVPANTVMFVGSSAVKLRAKPADNSKLVGTVYFGQQLGVTATQGDWAQVQHPNTGNAAYCQLNDLISTDPNTMSRLMYAQLATTPVYKAPSQKTGRLRNLKRGDTVTMTAITADGLWARVTADGANYGFVPSIYLDDTPAAEGTPVWCGSGSTAVMVNPDNWTQITTLSFGQPAFLVGYVNNNTIAKIRSSKGYVAYCDASALTTVDPANMNTPVYVQATGEFLGNGTGDNAKFFNVNKNAQLMLLGVDGSGTWALVRRGKQKLYIPYVYVGTVRLGKENRVVVVNQDVPLYSSNQSGASVMGTLPLGTRVHLVGGDRVYARVATISDGLSQPVFGYVPLEYLRGE